MQGGFFRGFSLEGHLMGEVAPISLKTQDGETQEAMGVAWMWGQDVPTTDWDCKSQLRSRAFHRILSWVL